MPVTLAKARNLSDLGRCKYALGFYPTSLHVKCAG